MPNQKFERSAQPEIPLSPEGLHPHFQFTRSFSDSDQDSSVPATREALGGKALSLWEMTQLSLPVPPWFTISTSTGREYLTEQSLPSAVSSEIDRQVIHLEQSTGERFGDMTHPLFVSVRSGAEISMPGTMKTILNIGLNDSTVHALAGQIGENAAWVAYYHFVKQFASDICHVDMSGIDKIKDNLKAWVFLDRINQFDTPVLQVLVEMTKERVKKICEEFPQDPHVQLTRAVSEVFASWNSPEASAYRKQFGISEKLGTAATIERMVWGNSEGKGSGSGVLLTRDPQTLNDKAVVGFLPHIQGDVVVGDQSHKQTYIQDLPVSMHAKRELVRWKKLLEAYHGFPRDIEFTIEVDAAKKEHVYILQDRKEPLTNPAYVLWLLEQIKNTKLSEEEAMRQATRRILFSVLDYDLDHKALEKARLHDLVATGHPMSYGHAIGSVVFSLEEANKQPKLEVVLMAPKNSMVDLLALPPNVTGIFTHRGGIGAHSGRIAARIEGRPIIFDGKLLQKIENGQVVTINGTTGEVFRGIIPIADKPGSSLLTTRQFEIVKSWDTQRRQNPWLFFVPPKEENSVYDITTSTTKLLSQKLEPKSRKAKIEAAFIKVIPQAIRMDYDIKAAGDVSGIKKRLKEILAMGADATLRTGYSPDVSGGEGPWVVFTSNEDVNDFFADPDYDKSKYGGYVKWRADASLSEIFVGHIPKGKLSQDPAIRHEHSAWTLSCTENNEIIIQVHPHSPHVRALDDEEADTFITYTIPVDAKTGRLADTSVREIGEKLTDDTLALNQATLVEETIRSWYTKYQLPHRLAALATIFPSGDNYSPPALQGQARISPDGSSWILCYDLNLDPLKEKNGRDIVIYADGAK